MNKPTNWSMVRIRGPLLAVIFLFGCAGSAYQNAPASLETAIQHAATKADHQALAAYYTEEASLFQADATWHEHIAKVYGTTPYPKAKGEAMQRYDALARKFREVAEEHQALARIHRQLAEEAPQNEVWSKEMAGRWVQRSTTP